MKPDDLNREEDTANRAACFRSGDAAEEISGLFHAPACSANSEIRRGEPDTTNKPVGDAPSPATNG